MSQPIRTDRILIVGGGIAALYAALSLGNRPVLIIAPEPLGQGASSTGTDGSAVGGSGAGGAKNDGCCSGTGGSGGGEAEGSTSYGSGSAPPGIKNFTPQFLQVVRWPACSSSAENVVSHFGQTKWIMWGSRVRRCA